MLMLTVSSLMPLLVSSLITLQVNQHFPFLRMKDRHGTCLRRIVIEDDRMDIIFEMILPLSDAAPVGFKLWRLSFKQIVIVHDRRCRNVLATSDEMLSCLSIYSHCRFRYPFFFFEYRGCWHCRSRYQPRERKTIGESTYVAYECEDTSSTGKRTFGRDGHINLARYQAKGRCRKFCSC